MDHGGSALLAHALAESVRVQGYELLTFGAQCQLKDSLSLCQFALFPGEEARRDVLPSELP